MIARTTIEVATTGRATIDISARVSDFVRQSGVEEGLCNLFITHTSASLMICENADPDVRGDLERFLSGLVIDGDKRFLHRDEGPDDMSAHIRSVLTATSLCVPVSKGRLALGTWQGVYLYEHRSSPHRRSIVLSVLS